MTKVTATVAALATGLVLAGTAAAKPPSPSFDPQTGTGFVTKDSVQAAFGWSQSQFAQDARSVTFTWDVLVPSLVTCSSGASGVLATFHSQTVIDDELRSGYELTGYGPETVLTDIPHGVGAPCPIGAGVVTSAFDDSANLSVFVNSGTQSEFLFSVL